MNRFRGTSENQFSSLKSGLVLTRHQLTTDFVDVFHRHLSVFGRPREVASRYHCGDADPHEVGLELRLWHVAWDPLNLVRHEALRRSRPAALKREDVTIAVQGVNNR